MKTIQYLVIFVFFGLISTSVAGDQSPIFRIPNNIARENGVTTTPQLMMPRVYVPTIPEDRHYLDHYSPDNYCNIEELKDVTTIEVQKCFKSKQRWLRL